MGENTESEEHQTLPAGIVTFEKEEEKKLKKE